MRKISIILMLIFSSILFSAKPPAGYKEAYGLYKQKDFAGARARFEEFVNNNPDTFYTGNGYFWMGVIDFASKDYHNAALNFELVTLCKNKWKFPDAMIRAGRAYLAMGDKESAKAQFERVASRYKGDKEFAKFSKDAEKRLKRIK